MGCPRVHFFYTNIGRGHPFYLDGIRQLLPAACLGDVRDVFDCCRGPSGLLWRTARWLYARGSSYGGERSLYSRLRARTDYTRAGPALHVMGAPIRRAVAQVEGPLVVAHPLLVAILREQPEVVYQHGELAVPREALLPGGHHVLVPDARAADVFMAAGMSADRLQVTGLCVEPALCAVAGVAMAARRRRLAAGEPLTGGFFSSGAEPAAHVASLVSAALSASAHELPVLLVARRGGRYHRHAVTAFQRARRSLTVCDPHVMDGVAAPPASQLCLYTTSLELERLTVGGFGRLDYMVAPAHERSHWALGLGLPLFMLDPPIGSFAPLNQARLLEEGVAESLPPPQAVAFRARLEARQQSGALLRAAERGWGRHAVDGFARAAAWLSARCR